jgi:hypothetical protein
MFRSPEQRVESDYPDREIEVVEYTVDANISAEDVGAETVRPTIVTTSAIDALTRVANIRVPPRIRGIGELRMDRGVAFPVPIANYRLRGFLGSAGR